MITRDEILKERARQLAVKKEIVEHDTGSIAVVEFLLFPEKYAVAASYVVEVLPLKDLTPVPGTADYVMGVINFRGSIISVINLKILFGLKEEGLTEMNKVVLLRNKQMEFGLLVDGITGVQSMALEQFKPPPVNLSEMGAAFIAGMIWNDTIFLDADKVLSNKLFKINQ